MQDPNEVQIGGDHYKGVKFQPWDWALYQLGYYETSAIAYIVRFRKKGGIQDLHKAQHYIDKMLAAALGDEYSNRCQADNLTVLDFNKQNNCDRWQGLAVWLLVQWRVREELVEARKVIDELIESVKDDLFLQAKERVLSTHAPLLSQLKDEPTPPPMVQQHAPSPAYDLTDLKAPLPPFKPLKPALKVPRAWDTDNDKFIDNE